MSEPTRICAECEVDLGSVLMHLDDDADVCMPCWNQYPQVLKDHAHRTVIENAKLEVRIRKALDLTYPEYSDKDWGYVTSWGLIEMIKAVRAVLAEEK